MSSVLAKFNAVADEDEKRISGMQYVGERFNHYLQQSAIPDWWDRIDSAMSNIRAECKLFYFHESVAGTSHEVELVYVRKRYRAGRDVFLYIFRYEYPAGSGTYHRLKLRFKRDREEASDTLSIQELFDMNSKSEEPNESTEDDDDDLYATRQVMRISIPRDVEPIITPGNYLSQIGDDIRSIADQTQRDRYLLGNIFFSKCR